MRVVVRQGFYCTHFKYLGTRMEEEGGMETEITKRVSRIWTLYILLGWEQAGEIGRHAAE